MTTQPFKTIRVAAPLLLIPGLLVACADKADTSEAITVAATDTACELSTTDATTGTNTFTITNNGSKVNEFYVLTEAGRILGEVENIGPGATRNLVVEIQEAGSYLTQCKPGMVGEGIQGPLKVTGDSVNLAEGDAALSEAVDRYLDYVRSQTKALQSQVDEFTAAIDSGDVETAKKLYPIARTPYERIEPVAESFPDDLDPRIDLREADVADGDDWTGFHPIEKDLFTKGKITDETKKLAEQLKKDVAELVDGVNADDYSVTPAQIASGAQGLLDEIATSKITGEEDIFSHTDLYDFQANLDGSKAAIASLEKPLQERDKDLLEEINKRFDAVQKLLDKYREGDGFISYEKVNESQRKELSVALDQLTEKVSAVQEKVTS
ncbi:EfeM/EfeO family lipoprotein [Corynebacterium sp. 320]|uniref:EfeM/EfeO family lipoprotein n=1 Tax=Corynebacterium zhongnanshanii TaxID=2768834 RepID=A0ABQ6VFS1_9CORY|nr:MULTISPECIES: iron uptake system protein EfeO [Corynebacterium]KAB1503889.1 EfeM/EfeO family lipoprotein [Corynebacterium sp. 320]KAB1553012.1 EfeM/EfeO family lipoprotein [Corynebacterium sp. 321]KAB1553768.1 EfeM/EfeO family lipoprotein [Corynebacterium sp. 319]KAB3523260.1 EfeM/EfeO family lipoprotein [Corynebacterium zhongnanshanii]KAB3528025.1 EfeM/EfeO family lipoprotein [Corynebacterium sp. 250]